MLKNIECEIRADITKDYEKILKNLYKSKKIISKTKRLSVMFFGKTDKGEIDVRVRITNGQAEIAVKKGFLHTFGRVEIINRINKSEFINYVKMFSLFDFKHVKVAERETYNFDYGNEIILSIVKAKSIVYLEIEKMTTEAELNKTKLKLEIIANNLGVKILKDKDDFKNLCNSLSNICDWNFSCSDKDYSRLNELLDQHNKKFPDKS